MVAFNPGGIPNPLLPGHLIPARLHGHHHQRRASDPFNPKSRSSSTTPTIQSTTADAEQWQSMADLMRSNASTTAAANAAHLNAALLGAQSLDSMAYLRTASLPHVPTQPLTAVGLTASGVIPPAETPAMANPRE